MRRGGWCRVVGLLCILSTLHLLLATGQVHNLYTKFCEAAALGQLLVGAQIAGRGVQTGGRNT